MKIETIQLTIKQMNNGDDGVYITDVAKDFEYDDKGNRTDKQVGTKYSCLLKYTLQPIAIKVSDETELSVSQEELDESENGVIEATVKGFVGKVYRDRSGVNQVSIKATAVTPII